MKNFILYVILLFSISILIRGSSVNYNTIVPAAMAGIETHNHTGGEKCSECENHSEKTEEHSDGNSEVHKTHEHTGGEECSECESHSEKTEEHSDASSEGTESGEHDGHNHKEGDSCGVKHHHDPFILANVLEQPWRHPEKLFKDMWLMRIIPLSFLFILSISLRQIINNMLRKAVK